MTQQRATAVPSGRIGKPKLTIEHMDRGQWGGAMHAVSDRDFDRSLGFALGLPPPETPPPRVSKEDGR